MRISFHTYRMVFALALCFFGVSCGVKKVATPIDTIKSDGDQAVNHVELHQQESPTDSLSFLGDLTKDSTIHINYAYGIPFIIDDSVPMFLPPIDKDPQGYISSQAYQDTRKGGGVNRFEDNISACGIVNPINNLLWLNKCINDWSTYVDSATVYLVSHQYLYDIHLFSIDDSINLLVFRITQYPKWEYCMADDILRRKLEVCYIYDCGGNLLGKSYSLYPVEWKREVEIEDSNKIPVETKMLISMLNKRGKRIIIFRMVIYKTDPNYQCDYF